MEENIHVITIEKLRTLCLSFPEATEQIQWGYDLVFKVGGKMFCVTPTEPSPVMLAFKCDDDAFVELQEVDGVIPAPYMARAKWVALDRYDRILDRELVPLITRAYEVIRDKLPKKTIATLTKPQKKAKPQIKRPQIMKKTKR